MALVKTYGAAAFASAAAPASRHPLLRALLRPPEVGRLCRMPPAAGGPQSSSGASTPTTTRIKEPVCMEEPGAGVWARILPTRFGSAVG